jgi:hypothetical protein
MIGERHANEQTKARELDSGQLISIHGAAMNQYACHTCGLKIDGSYILFPEMQNRAYHRDCFLCQACGKRIDDEFGFHEAGPYHALCLSPLLDLRCPACGESITGSAIQAMDHKWHPEHFVCTNCQEPLPEEHYRQQAGKPYCETCYQSLFLRHCDICRRPLAGHSVRNHWGDQYCGSHVYEFRECSCCRRPICPSITGGGSDTRDGRPLCNLCRKTSVNHLNQAWPAFNKVRRYLTKQGLDLGHASLSLDLVDRVNLSSIASHAKPDRAFNGLAAMPLVPLTAGAAPGPQEQIRILHGLPWELFTAVCACELGHAWLHMKKNSMLTAEAEQDFCKSLSSRWLDSLGTPTSEVWVKILRETQSNPYSMGPRARVPARKSGSYSL